jgi:hypothetical protein
METADRDFKEPCAAPGLHGSSHRRGWSENGVAELKMFWNVVLAARDSCSAMAVTLRTISKRA